MSVRPVTAGFTDSRENVLTAIYTMGSTVCAYSMGGKWADRCDCKYGLHEKWPTAGERGNGCPELRSLYVVIAAMTDDEWARLVLRGTGSFRGAVLGGRDIGARMEVGAAELRQAAAAIGRAFDALSDEGEIQ
jgi:hypothetical protein